MIGFVLSASVLICDACGETVHGNGLISDTLSMWDNLSDIAIMRDTLSMRDTLPMRDAL
jgi:hypothetical protein